MSGYDPERMAVLVAQGAAAQAREDAKGVPERIWLYPDEAWRLTSDLGHPYILATPAALADSPEVAAIVAAERDRLVALIEAAGSKRGNRWINRAELLAALRTGETG